MADSPSLDGQSPQSAVESKPKAADTSDHGDPEVEDRSPDPEAVTNVTPPPPAEANPPVVADAADADTAAAHPAEVDTVVADGGMADTVVVDAAEADTVVVDAAEADTVVADGGEADTVVADAAEADTVVADPIADEGAADSAGDGKVAETARIDAAEPVDPVVAASERTMVANPGSGGRSVTITPTELRSIPLPSGADIARWSGRGGLPSPAPSSSEASAATPVAGQLRAPAPATQAPVDDDAPRRQPEVLPWLAALAAVVLVAVLIFGIWLIYRALDTDEARPTRMVSPSPVASSVAPTSSSEQPSSPNPPAETTSHAETPALVVVPPVQGATEEMATEMLRQLGFQVTIRRKESTAEPGTVLGVDPGTGTSVPAGSAVTLTVAKPSPSPSPRPSTTVTRTFSSSSSWWSSSWSMR